MDLADPTMMRRGQRNGRLRSRRRWRVVEALEVLLWSGRVERLL